MRASRAASRLPSAQMPFGPGRGKQIGDATSVGEIELVEREAGLVGQAVEPGVFQPWVVVRVDTVEAHHLEAVGEQAMRQMKADEAGRAGDENRAG